MERLFITVIKIVDTESIISATMLFLTVVAAQFMNNLEFLRSSWPFYVPVLRPISSRKDIAIKSFLSEATHGQ